MYRHIIVITLSFITACGSEPAETALCSGEQADINRVPTAVPPDWEEILLYPEATPLGRVQGLDPVPENIEYRERIQAWDCITLSWWTPSEPMKIVQVWTDETECELFEASMIETFDCDSHEGLDNPYRDADGDGYYITEGDCDDDSALKAPDLEERCDSIDNDCDGVSDEYLDCADIEAVDEGM